MEICRVDDQRKKDSLSKKICYDKYQNEKIFIKVRYDSVEIVKKKQRAKLAEQSLEIVIHNNSRLPASKQFNHWGILSPKDCLRSEEVEQNLWKFNNYSLMKETMIGYIQPSNLLTLYSNLCPDFYIMTKCFDIME